MKPALFFPYKNMSWSSCLLRKTCRCIDCASPLKFGTWACRPITNNKHRGDRLCHECGDNIASGRRARGEATRVH